MAIFEHWVQGYLGDSGDVDLESIKQGVISKGKVSGKLKFIDLNDDWKKKVNMHFHDDHAETQIRKSEAIIFVADRPDISLLALLNEHDSSSIGFLFRGGSMLSHLCLVLREKGIPARFISNSDELAEGEVYVLDTL